VASRAHKAFSVTKLLFEGTSSYMENHPTNPTPLKRPLAELDIAEQVSYFIGNDAFEVALRFIEAVEEGLVFLSKRPRVGSRCPFQGRSVEVKKWPVPGFRNHWYLYELVGGQVTLLRLAHAAQDKDSLEL
jgi:plasmid stabilization system protein ParE